MGKVLSFLRNGVIRVNYCWNYGSLKLLLHFIKYRLDQCNNKHMKTAVNLTMRFFESRHLKKCLIKVWSFLAQPPKNDGPVIFWRNWKEITYLWLIFLNFTNIRHLVHWKCIIWAKSDFPIINSVCEKVWFTINELSKMLFHFIACFIFRNFKWLLSKLLLKNHPFL